MTAEEPGEGLRGVSPAQAVIMGLLPDTPLVPMGVSLGFLVDMLWVHIPECRPPIARWLAGEVDDALGTGRPLRRLSPGRAGLEFLWHPVLRDALDAAAVDETRVAELLVVVRIAYTAQGPEQRATQDGLKDYVLEYLTEPRYRAIVRRVDLELYRILESALPKLMRDELT